MHKAQSEQGLRVGWGRRRSRRRKSLQVGEQPGERLCPQQDSPGSESRVARVQ